MSREYDALDPYTKRVVEDDYISPPWLDEIGPYSAVPTSSEVPTSSGTVVIGSL